MIRKNNSIENRNEQDLAYEKSAYCGVLPLADDTLPAIRMKFEPLFLIPLVVVPWAALFVGGHSYQIQGKKRFVSSSVKPYFEAAHDPVLTNLYTLHRQNRIIWYGSSAAGGVVVFVGALQIFVAVVTLNASAAQSVNTYFGGQAVWLPPE